MNPSTEMLQQSFQSSSHSFNKQQQQTPMFMSPDSMHSFQHQRQNSFDAPQPQKVHGYQQSPSFYPQHHQQSQPVFNDMTN